MKDLTIRAAKPDPVEGAAFARYFDMASDGLARWMLGPRFTDVIGRAYREPGHDLSYESVRFAESDGVTAGMVNGYSSAEHDRSRDGPLLRAAGLRFPRLLGTWMLARPLFAFMDELPAGDWYVQAVAVDPSFRGSGIGSLLLDDVEAQARASGSDRLALDVAVGNDGAKRLYERRGMAVVARSESVRAMGGTAVERMVKDL